MIYTITHITEYEYNDFVSYCHNIAIMKPRIYSGQELMEYNCIIDPHPDDLLEYLDFFGNNATRFSIQHQHNKLSVVCKSLVNKMSVNTVDIISNWSKQITLQKARESYQIFNPELLDVKQYILESPLIRRLSDDIKAYALMSFSENRSVFDSVLELNQRIYNDFTYDPGYTNISTPINDVFRDKKGVCQDFAHIAIACLRSVGLPARYVSGYIETLPPPGQEKLVGVDASHAWFSTFLPRFGWLDFDPTNNQITSFKHIVVAWGRDYYDVTPLKGVIYSNGENKMNVSVDIQRY